MDETRINKLNSLLDEKEARDRELEAASEKAKAEEQRRQQETDQKREAGKAAWDQASQALDTAITDINSVVSLRGLLIQREPGDAKVAPALARFSIRLIDSVGTTPYSIGVNVSAYGHVQVRVSGPKAETLNLDVAAGSSESWEAVLEALVESYVRGRAAK